MTSAVTLAAAVALVAAAAPPATLTGATPGEVAIRQDPGEAIFRGKGNCFTCHKQDATGTPLAPDLTDSEWINFEDGRPSQQEMEALIREGVSRPVQHPAPMPPMGGGSLSDEEVTQVARYALSLSAEDSLD
ncbi:MAG: c-type cytochrome [Longimicrobiales bacterium]